MYPHFNIYPSVPGDRIDRSYTSIEVPETTDTLHMDPLALNAGPPLKVDLSGYPALNICMHLLSSVPYVVDILIVTIQTPRYIPTSKSTRSF